MIANTYNFENFTDIFNEFQQLPLTIETFDETAFDKAMQDVEAKKIKKIVYLWCSGKPVNRLKGQSKIVYIGQTKNSFAIRYNNYSKWISTKANSLKLGHIINEYDGISFWVCDYNKFGKSLKEAEGQLLWWYFQNHYEYPPMNYTKTKIRNDQYPKLDI